MCHWGRDVDRNRNISFDLDAIGHVLSDRLLVVPAHQRPYSWLEEQVSAFWSDLLEAVNTGRPEYFLGTIVLTPDQSTAKSSIIDGQQRLATTTLLLAAFRNALVSGGLVDDAQTVSGKFLATRELGATSPEPRLVLNSEDENFFRSLVVSTEPSQTVRPQAPDSHDRILEAFSALTSRVSGLVDQEGGNWPGVVYRWVDYLEKRVQVIVAEVSNEADAFLIFETLNDRGLDLTVADLLKNHLFRLSGGRIETVKRAWLNAEGAVEQAGEREPFISFLRHYWSSSYGLVRERELYKEIRNRIGTEQQAVDFAEALHDASFYYAALLSRSHEFWAELGSGSRADVETLLRLRLEQSRPLLLAAMQYFPKPELRKLLKALISWSVRILVAGRAGGGQTETAYSNAAVAIRRGQIKDTNELFLKIEHVVPTDDEFQGAFRVAQPISRVARYYLLALEAAERNQTEPELVPNSDEDQVNLEHILPRNFVRGDWPAFDPNEAAQWAARLGNLVLLRRAQNQKIGNRPFTEKKPILAGSDLKLTHMIGTIPDWTPEAIAERQAALAKQAPRTWPRKP